MNHSTIKAQTLMSASWFSTESISFNSWSLGVMKGHDRVKHFYICFNGENLWKSLQETTEPKKVQIYFQGDLVAIKKSNFACINMRNITHYDSGERCSPWASCLNIFLKNWQWLSISNVNLLKGIILMHLSRYRYWLVQDHIVYKISGSKVMQLYNLKNE
jgi:hypothetical protein